MSTQLLVKGEKVDFEMRKKVLLAALLVSKLVLYLGALLRLGELLHVTDIAKVQIYHPW